jgi:hypothetical protein
MVELTYHGLTGLTALLVMAFRFACGDELIRPREKRSYGLIDNAVIETWARSLRFRRDLEALHG